MSTDLLTSSMGYADRFVVTFSIYSPRPNTQTVITNLLIFSGNSHI